MYKEIYAKAKAYEAETVRFLMDMVKIPSFSTTEKEVVLAIKKEMEAAGFDEVFIDPLGNVIGRIGNGPKVIAFDAHVDTVYPGERSLWDFDPFDAHVKDGKVWGRGTVDQEGGMASMVTAGRIIKDLGLQEGYQGAGPSPKIRFMWELAERMANGKRFTVTKKYTPSMHEKATLYKDIVSWQGHDFSAQEKEGSVKLRTLVLGQQCLLNIVKKDNGWTEVGAVLPAMKGQEVLTPETPPEYIPNIVKKEREKQLPKAPPAAPPKPEPAF